MVGKLAVVAVGMFAFGYALVPLYRAICEMTGINILALSERQVPGGASGGKDVRVPDNTQVDTEPHHHGRVRRQRARPLGFQAGAAFDAGASRAS